MATGPQSSVEACPGAGKLKRNTVRFPGDFAQLSNQRFMKFVRLSPQNIRLLDHIATDVFDYAVEPAQLEAFLQCPRHVMVLAVEDGIDGMGEIVVGMASAVEYFHPDKPPQLWINEVGVTPARQNRGIGRQLVQEMIEIGRERGCCYAWLGTGRSNLPAQRCFQGVAGASELQEFILCEWTIDSKQKPEVRDGDA